MLYKFKSRATADVIMLESNGRGTGLELVEHGYPFSVWRVMHSAVHVLAVESIVRLSPHHGSRLEQSIGMRAQHLVQGDPAALESHGATRQIEPVGAQHLGGTFGIGML